MKTFEVTDDIVVDVLIPGNSEIPPLIYINNEECDQTVTIFAHEIRPLISALTEAAVWLANEAT